MLYRLNGTWSPRLAACLACMVLACLVPARAEDALTLLRTRDCPGGRISLVYHGAPLRQVLADLQRMRAKTNLKVRAENVERENAILAEPVSVSIEGVLWDVALNYLAERMRLSVDRRQEKDGLIFLEKVPAFSAVLDGVGLGAAVAEIARFGSANVVFSPKVDVRRPVHIALNDVPWPQAIENVLAAHGCVMLEDESGVIRVVSAEEAGVRRETRLRPLRFIVPEGGLSLDDIRETVYREENGEADLPPARTAEKIVSILRGVMSRDGEAEYERRTNTLVLTDVPEKVREMLRIVDAFDVPAHQVLLETTFAAVAGGAGSFPDVKWDLDAAWRGEKWDGEPMDGFSKTGVMNRDAFEAFVLNARADPCIDIMQAPQMLVMDGEEASVFVGDLRCESIAGAGGEVAPGGENRGVLVGNSMRVIPNVQPGADRVVLEVFPVQTGRPQVDRNRNGEVRIDLPARLNVKAARTRMVLRSGETGVVSGLFDRFDADGVIGAAAGAAELFKMPLRKNASPEIRRNNFFLVTPTIVSPDCGVEFDSDVEAAKESLAILR